jgi:hypothetical protein
MNQKLPRATHQGIVKIGDVQIPCAVLDDGTRVIRERSIAKALGKKGSGGYWKKKKTKEEGALLPEYVSAKYLEPFVPDDTRDKLINPIHYRQKSGNEALGVSASFLPEICNIWLIARDQGALSTEEQRDTAKKAEILMRGLAHIGIIALIDEATGYEKVRDRDALEKILEQWIKKELAPWAKTFPDEFYEQMFRLKGWQYKPIQIKKPQVVGHYTNDIVYDRLEKGVLDELKSKEPIDSAGH